MMTVESARTSPGVDQNRDERLAADALHRAPVTRIDVLPLHVEALVRKGERDALDVRRERNSVDAHHLTAEADQDRLAGVPPSA